MSSSRNFAARAGRWSARHRRAAILGWIAFVIASVAIGGAVGTSYFGDEEWGAGESRQANQVLDAHFEQPAREQVLIQARGEQTFRDPEFRAAVDDVVRRAARADTVIADVRAPAFAAADVSGVTRGGAVSADGRSVLVDFAIRGSADEAGGKVDEILAGTAALQRQHPSVRIEQAGDASADEALSKAFDDDLAKARNLSLPVTLFILVLAFGSLVAAGIPVLLSFTGVMATLGLIALPSQLGGVDEAISEVVLLIGMAVGVDYSLFYLRREREERAAGRSPEAALEAAAATSGRSVLISGLTVIAAMAGMYFAGNKSFASFGTGTIMVVAVSMVASLTVLPAVLSKLGDGVMRARVPLLGRARERASGEPRLWGAVVDRVLRRPVVATVAAGGALVALAVPAFGLHTAVPGLEGLPKGLPIVDTIDRIQTAFPGGPAPAEVVVQAADVTAPTEAAAIERLRSQALATGQMHEPIAVRTSPDRTVAVVSIPLAGEGTDAASDRALETLREKVIPQTIGLAPGARADVTGNTAISKDFNDQMKANAPVVFVFVLTMAFLLLLVTFRSIVIPIKAIVLNLLSVGAAYGLLVLVFQNGWGESLLGFESNGGITSWLPMFLFVILFGLSMDYHVFILARIREAVDRGMPTDEAVAHGIKSTAGVVTSAAMVMVAVFAIFGTLGAVEFKQMGVGLAAAILIDATIIRAVLLPATMKLLGDWNWYLPRALRWLPRVAHEPSAEAARA